MQSEHHTKQNDAIHKRGTIAIVSVIVIGLLASVILYVVTNTWEQNNLRNEFVQRANSYANAVQTSLNGNVEALVFLGDFFNNSTTVTRQEFSSFVKSVLPRYKGIHAFSWNPLVADRERAEYETRARKEGVVDFEFTERTADNRLVKAGQRAEYVVVYYIEPLPSNRPALGFDIASNPTRLKAIKQGFRTGKLSATDRITLVQETGSQFGVLLLLPIYQQGARLDTPEEREKHRKGFVVEVLRIGDAIESALKGFPDQEVELYLYDMSADKDKRLLYCRQSGMTTNTEPTLTEEGSQQGLYWSEIFDFAGRQWKIVFSPSHLYFKNAHRWHAWLVLASCLLLTIMLAYYLFKRTTYIAEIEEKINQEALTNRQLAREISERELAEEKAIRFGDILERSLNEIYVFSAETLNFIQVNKGARKNLGYSMEELQVLTPVDIKPEYTLDSFTRLVEPLRTGAKDVVVFQTVHRRKDESQYPVEVHLQLVAFDTMPVFVAIVIDITDKLRMEERLRQSHKIEAIGTLAGGIAHDFNNILSVIMGYTELSLNETEQGSSLHNNLQEILQAGGRAQALISQILAFSRQADNEREPIQLKPICEEALKFLRSSLPATIEIQQDLFSDEMVMADPTQLHQVIMNICTNAGHAMRDDGGVLTIKLTDVTLAAENIVDIPELTPGRYLELRISDTGHGIPEEILDRIFNPFFTTKKTGEGTGMGLSVALGIVSSYKGAITVTSEPGKGSTFIVYLPVVEIKAPGVPDSQGPAPAGTERILFVDDEIALVKIGEKILTALGYTVTTCTDSAEALQLFRDHPNRFDLVITDMTMPNMSGDKLSVKLIDIRPDIPIILCTGYSSAISDEKAKQLGIKAFAYKPVASHDFARLVRRILDEPETDK